MKKILFSLLSTAICMPALAETVESWNLLEGPDGLTWSVVTKAEMENLGNEYYDDLRYKTVEVTVSDASHQVRGTFTIDISGYKANSFSVFGPLTQHLFNNDDQLELGIDFHVPGNATNNYTSKMMFRAYSLDGTQQMEGAELEGNVMIAQCAQCECLTIEQNDAASQTYNFNVYLNDGSGIQLAHTFSMDNDKFDYMLGPRFMVQKLPDGLHYLLYHYEKPTCLRDEWGEIKYDPITWMPCFTPDNNFLVEHFDQNFQKVDELSVPVVAPEGIVLRMFGSLGSSEDLTVGHFSGDDRYNYELFFSDMDQNWNDLTTLAFYAQGNKLLGELNGNNPIRLTDIKDEPEQWAMLKVNDLGEQYISLLEMPSFTEVAQIPAMIDNKLISFNIDRFADPAEGYKYVIGLNEPETNIQNDVIVQYGIYHKDFTVDDYVLINVGPDAEAFYPYISAESLDPHLFYADDQREYIFLAKVRSHSGHIYDALYIANQQGEILNTFSSEDSLKGELSDISILNYGSEHPELMISYFDYDTSSSFIEFYTLPFDASSIQPLSHVPSTESIFNLHGQRAHAMVPGLYIRNGQKVNLSR